VKLGLQDVLYDPKTKTVFVPNTGMTEKIDEAQQKVIPEPDGAQPGED
jgi:hypothetical protein